jgi:hypothetical protein
MNNFIELKIIDAVKKLLTGRVNEIIGDIQEVIPVIEFGNYKNNSVVVPVIALAGTELTEKERIIKLDTFALTITFSIEETSESERNLYVYSGAVGRAFYDNPTLDGVVDRAVITSKKNVPPKKLHCGQEWELIISVRITVENMHPCIFST